MIWWFLILGLSTLVVVCVVIAFYMRVRQHMQAAPGTEPEHQADLPTSDRPSEP
jgi:hypothetical protein